MRSLKLYLYLCVYVCVCETQPRELNGRIILCKHAHKCATIAARKCKRSHPLWCETENNICTHTHMHRGTRMRQLSGCGNTPNHARQNRTHLFACVYRGAQVDVTERAGADFAAQPILVAHAQFHRAACVPVWCAVLLVCATPLVG